MDHVVGGMCVWQVACVCGEWWTVWWVTCVCGRWHVCLWWVVDCVAGGVFVWRVADRVVGGTLVHWLISCFSCSRPISPVTFIEAAGSFPVCGWPFIVAYSD